LTSARVFTLWVPARRLFNCQIHHPMQNVGPRLEAEDLVIQIDLAGIASSRGF